MSDVHSHTNFYQKQEKITPIDTKFIFHAKYFPFNYPHKYCCQHDEFSLRNLKKSEDFTLYLDELLDQDEFPKIKPGYCTEECKEKMKEIYRITFERYIETINKYYSDSRIFEYNLGKNPRECDIWMYREFFSTPHPISPQDEYARMVIKAMKVGIKDGKPVRLCELPPGVQCNFDAKNLPDSEEDE
ncbi:hypothetical protein ACTFIZ_009627 [Dictyostelium cf. discoideum]